MGEEGCSIGAHKVEELAQQPSHFDETVRMIDEDLSALTELWMIAHDFEVALNIFLVFYISLSWKVYSECHIFWILNSLLCFRLKVTHLQAYG